MAIKRAFRAGQMARLPLLCDPLYQERRAARPKADVEAEEALFTETLDAACLKTSLDGVTCVTIRGLSGGDYLDSDQDAIVESGKDFESIRLANRQSMARLRRGLVDPGVEGLPVAKVAPYPVEELSGPGGIGELWPTFLREVNERIVTWSHLGESAGSSCALLSAEPS